MDCEYLEHLLIVDDTSTDSTPQILERWVRDYQINSCHTYKDDSAAVLERWPQHYTGKNAGG